MGIFIFKYISLHIVCVCVCLKESEDVTDGKNGFNPWPGFRYTGTLRAFPVVSKLIL